MPKTAHNMLSKLLKKGTFRSLLMIQCNISVMRLTGPAGLAQI